MDRAAGNAIFHRVVPAGVLGVATTSHQAVVADVGEGVRARGRIVGEHRIGPERALAAEAQGAVSRGRYAAIELVVDGLARARAVAGLGIAAPGKAVVAGVGGRHVGELAGLRIDARRSIEHHRPAGHELFPGLDAQPRLRQVVRRDDEARLIAVAVDQRFAFVVVAVFRQAVADPAQADVIRAVDGDAVPGQRAIAGEEILGAGAGCGWRGGWIGGKRRMVQGKAGDKRRDGAPPYRPHLYVSPWNGSGTMCL